MSRILFLDDMEVRWRGFWNGAKLAFPGSEIVWAQTAKEAITHLSEGVWDLVSLDHDLDQDHYDNPGFCGEGSGTEVVQWIAKNAERFGTTKFVIHSLNSVAWPRMVQDLRDAGLMVKRIPFTGVV